MENLKLFSKNKTVLVTGAAGFLGSTIVNQLIENDYKVIALVRKSSNSKHLKDSRIQIENGDVRDSNFLSELVRRVDYVVHAAATFSGDWDYFYRVNVQSTDNLLQYSVKNKLEKFIYISSVSVYEHSSWRPGFVFTENMPYEKERYTKYYAKSKMQAEKLVWKYIQNSDLPAVIFRPGAIYGPRGHIFPASLGLGIGEERIILMGNSNSKLPLSYVENVANAVCQSLEKDDINGECFNLVEDETYSRKEYVKSIKELAEVKLFTLNFPIWFMQLIKFVLKTGFRFIGKKAPLSELNFNNYSETYSYSNEKFKKSFGDKPYVNFDESIHITMDWHKQRLTPKRSEGIHKGKIIIQSSKKLNVGIIGCGKISYAHLNILQKLPNANRIVVADPIEENLKNISEKYPINNTYSDYKGMLESENLDIVHILTPPHLHCEIAMNAIKQKINVLVEKPMTVDAVEAERMIQAAENHHVKLCVMHNHLYDQVMIQAREILAKGQLGRITFVESWYGTQFGATSPYEKEHWIHKLPGSLFQDYMPHALYVLLDILGGGELKQTFANYSGGVQNVEFDELKVLIQKGSILGLVSVSLSVSPRYQFLKIYGTSGSLHIDFLNKSLFFDKQMGPVPKSINRILMSFIHAKKLISSGIKNTLKVHKADENIFEGSEREIQLFYRSVLLDEKVPVSGKEGFETMVLMDQIWEKIKIGNQYLTSNRLRA